MRPTRTRSLLRQETPLCSYGPMTGRRSRHPSTRCRKPFPRGMGSLMLVVLSSPIPPVCVGEPPGRHHIQLLAIDTAVAVPSPYNVFMMTGLLGPMPPAIPQTGALADFVYAASRYGGGLERLTIEDRSLLGGFGQYLLEFPVQHCLGGEWLDGERVVRITPPSSTHFTAEVVSGTIC